MIWILVLKDEEFTDFQALELVLCIDTQRNNFSDITLYTIGESSVGLNLLLSNHIF